MHSYHVISKFIYHGSQQFSCDRFIWPHDTVYDILREEGFSKVEAVSYEVDPSYTGDIDLQAYTNLHDHKVILAWK